MKSSCAQNVNGKPAAAERPRDSRPDAARKRLSECKDRKDTCEALREIVSNLLGCEEMALFEWNAWLSRFSLIWCFGIEQQELRLPEMVWTSLWARVIAGEAYLPVDASGGVNSSEHDGPSAIVPIRFNGNITAVLVLLRLLPQKSKLDDLDCEVLSVVSREAGRPFCAAQSQSFEPWQGSDE